MSNHGTPGRSEFARSLHEAMRRKGMSASDLAAAVWGTGAATINGKSYTVARNRDRISIYLSGKGWPRMDTLARMGQALDVAPERLAPEVVQRAQERGPGERVTLKVLGHDTTQAELVVNAVVPTKLGLRIAKMINEAQALEGAP